MGAVSGPAAGAGTEPLPEAHVLLLLQKRSLCLKGGFGVSGSSLLPCRGVKAALLTAGICLAQGRTGGVFASTTLQAQCCLRASLPIPAARAVKGITV